jgi:hypothetical protein
MYPSQADKQGTFVHQAKYTKDLMKKFNMIELKPVSNFDEHGNCAGSR